MPRLLVLNPQHDAAMTRAIGAAARGAAPGTEIVAPGNRSRQHQGPYDQALCCSGCWRDLRGEPRLCGDGHHLLDDPTVCRRGGYRRRSVIGIAARAALRGRRDRASDRHDGAAGGSGSRSSSSGMAPRASVRGVRAADVKCWRWSVSAFTYRRIRDCAERLLREDAADAIILGCAACRPLGRALPAIWACR
jgi:Asp/Glu/hydantoin racemase